MGRNWIETMNRREEDGMDIWMESWKERREKQKRYAKNTLGRNPNKSEKGYSLNHSENLKYRSDLKISYSLDKVKRREENENTKYKLKESI